jgi:TonB family protein
MKNNISYTVLVFLISLVISHISYAAQETFIKAELLERKAPEYPDARAKKSHEGVVELGMMVSTLGTVYSPIVNFSTHGDFEVPALEAVKQYKFNPATLNGMPVDSYYDVRILFDLKVGDDVVSERFSKFYKSVKKELAKDEPNRKKLERNVRSMSETRDMTHYSLASLARVKMHMQVKLGDNQAKINAFEQLLMFEDVLGQNGPLLDDDTRTWTKSAIITTQLNLGQLQAAYWSYLDLLKTAPESAKKFDANVVNIKKVLSSGEAFSQQLMLGDRSYQEVSLSDTKFVIQDIVGEIDKFIFRCQKGFTEIDYQQGSEYFVLSDWGRCKIQISGSQDTVATLIQYR